MEQFAAQNTEEIKVIGVGTLDSQELAESFQADADAKDLQLVWSKDQDIWENYGVSSQHTTILLDSSGAELQRWNNFVPQDVATAVG